MGNMIKNLQLMDVAIVVDVDAPGDQTSQHHS